MKFLIDASKQVVASKLEQHPSLVAGQLLTPLTKYANWGSVFAIDNGAFSVFHKQRFSSLLQRNIDCKSQCLFVVVPDIVANARRTLEIWRHRHSIVGSWPMAFVAQDGMEDLEVPWGELQTLFVGGGDPWKDSRASLDIVKTAKTLGKRVHVGRVNTVRRYRLFAEAGADTCDGSGVAMYDHMLEDIATALAGDNEPTLFDSCDIAIEAREVYGD
jgi:hypothetical protein